RERGHQGVRRKKEGRIQRGVTSPHESKKAVAFDGWSCDHRVQAVGHPRSFFLSTPVSGGPISPIRRSGGVRVVSFHIPARVIGLGFPLRRKVHSDRPAR